MVVRHASKDRGRADQSRARARSKTRREDGMVDGDDEDDEEKRRKKGGVMVPT